MSPRAREEVFACPFCQAASVSVIGRGGRFVHYRCEACAEVWTGMQFPAESMGPLDRPEVVTDVRRH